MLVKVFFIFTLVALYSCTPCEYYPSNESVSGLKITNLDTTAANRILYLTYEGYADSIGTTYHSFPIKLHPTDSLTTLHIYTQFSIDTLVLHNDKSFDYGKELPCSDVVYLEIKNQLSIKSHTFDTCYFGKSMGTYDDSFVCYVKP